MLSPLLLRGDSHLSGVFAVILVVLISMSILTDGENKSLGREVTAGTGYSFYLNLLSMIESIRGGFCNPFYLGFSQCRSFQVYGSGSEPF